ncbi:hypothetical protein AC579_5309 [Pseudocercospora musae]|uniref:Uncharacterized protein n=1 Tax=Pseudocercospora musae TaxID=113226 RepID=A0A139HZG3_9PEZI|nr:hypothetical protein AC579_5309 [Pseudocercospora musae]
MMQNEERFDVTKWFKARPIREEDGLTLGHLLDMSNLATLEVSRGLVRPTRTKIGMYPQSHAISEVPAAAAIDDAPLRKYKRNDRIRNFYTTQVVVVNKQPYEMSHILMDTGSVVDTINGDVARSLMLELYPIQPYTLKFANGHRGDMINAVDLDVNIHGIQRKIQLLVVEGETPYSILLGLPALYAFRVPAIYTIREAPGSAPIPVTREQTGSRQTCSEPKAIERKLARKAKVQQLLTGRAKPDVDSDLEYESPISAQSDSEDDEALIDQVNQYALLATQTSKSAMKAESVMLSDSEAEVLKRKKKLAFKSSLKHSVKRKDSVNDLGQ